MKRCLAALCCLMLASAVMPTALAAQGDANLASTEDMEGYDYVNDGCVLGDTLYLTAHRTLYTWKAGEADVTAYAYGTAISQSDAFVNDIVCTDKSLYAIVQKDAETINDSGFIEQELELYEIVRLQDGQVTFGSAAKMDLEPITAALDNDIQYFEDFVLAGDKIYAKLWDNANESYIGVFNTDGSSDGTLDVEDSSLITPYKDGQLLIKTHDFDNGEVALCVYDPEAQSLTTVAAPDSIRDIPYGLVYSTESDRLFYCIDSYVMAADGFDLANAVQVCEVPETYSDRSALLMPGDYYVCVSDSATCVRNTDPNAQPTESITVINSSSGSAVTSAYYSFGNTHSGIGVVVQNGALGDEDIIDAMMNHDSEIDVYELSVDSQAYDALFNRSYIAEMNGSSVLTQAVEGMYSGMRDVLEKDGKVYAIPTSIRGSTIAYHPRALARLGLGAEDMPDNWADFLALLKSLEGEMTGNEVTLFDASTTVSRAKQTMIEAIMGSYTDYVEINGEEIGYDTEELRSLLTAALDLDYEALGCQPDHGDTEYNASETWDLDEYDSKTLLVSDGRCNIGGMVSSTEPLLLSVIKGEKAVMPIEMTVAFINPYTEHMDAALEFMETVYAELPDSVLYNISDALNEPQHYADYDSMLNQYEQSIADIDTQIETAEPVDVPVLEQQRQQLQDNMASYQENSWEIRTDEIEWYRNRADRIYVSRYNYLNSWSDDGITAMTSKLVDGEITLDTFLSELDHTSRMMVLEGN